MVISIRQRLEMHTLIGVCLSNRGYTWSKIDMNFFLIMLNGEWLVGLKHKPLEDKEVTKISVHQGFSIQER